MKFDHSARTYFLKPSQMCFVREPSIVRTVLGSCVTVTMFNRRKGVAAACHPVLPLCRESGCCESNTCRAKYKYVECVIPEMIQRFQQNGISPMELEFKLFGGSQMFGTTPDGKKIMHVGSMNVSMAKHILQELKVNPESVDVGGKQGRKLVFDTGTGDVWLKRFKSDTEDLAAKREVLDQVQILAN